MINFSNRKTQKKVAATVAILIVAAMLIGLLSSF